MPGVKTLRVVNTKGLCRAVRLTGRKLESILEVIVTANESGSMGTFAGRASG